MLRNGIEARGRDEASAQEPGRCRGTRSPWGNHHRAPRARGVVDAEQRNPTVTAPASWGHQRHGRTRIAERRWADEGGPGPAPHVARQKRRGGSGGPGLRAPGAGRMRDRLPYWDGGGGGARWTLVERPRAKSIAVFFFFVSEKDWRYKR
jgi:hypothetical protein